MLFDVVQKTKMNTRTRRWFLGLGCLAVFSCLIFVFGTSKGQIRRDTGLLLSPLAVFYGSSVASGEAGTNVAVSFPSASERSRIEGWFTWSSDDKVVFNHNIPWYEDLVSSTPLMRVTDLARDREKSRDWQVTRFSKFGHEYHLYYQKGTNLLWIVQTTK